MRMLCFPDLYLIQFPRIQVSTFVLSSNIDKSFTLALFSLDYLPEPYVNLLPPRDEKKILHSRRKSLEL